MPSCLLLGGSFNGFMICMASIIYLFVVFYVDWSTFSRAGDKALGTGVEPVPISFRCTLSYTSPISAISAVFGYRFRGIRNLYYL